jgi:hypothetical protein
MRERISAFGGELDFGPRHPRGWRVTARMPGRDGIEATRDIAAGDAVLAPGATRRLIRQFATQQPEQPSGPRAEQIRRALTGREQDVFSFIAAGRSNSEIAASLHLSAGTVKIHAVVLAYESTLVIPGTTPPNRPRDLH